MTSWAIVAVPSEGDLVWKVSSEKIPHMTLLYLGDQTDNPHEQHIAEYVQHAVETTMHRFGMSVDRRGLLGSENADVLFFGKHNVDFLEEFRSALLKNDEIFKAWSSVEQYPSWTPHLTLGYPSAPANKLSDDRESIGWVNFDKIMLWTGEFSGPEFVLKEQELYMSDEVEDFLAHYGVKGMKWGKRKARDDSGGETTTAPKRLSRKEVRALNKEGRKKFYQDKADRILSESLKKGDDVLIQVVTPGSTYPSVVTGKEFAAYAARGGAFNVRMTDIYATKTTGAYELNESRNAGYQKVKR